MKSADDVWAEMRRNGITVADWARERGFGPQLVYAVLTGRRQCVRGQSHDIAIALGLKEIPSNLCGDKQLSPQPQSNGR